VRELARHNSKHHNSSNQQKRSQQDPWKVRQKRTKFLEAELVDGDDETSTSDDAPKNKPSTSERRNEFAGAAKGGPEIRIVQRTD
jgi:hypothetical protein